MDDESLEAELLALEGKSSGSSKSRKTGKSGQSGMMSMGDLDAMMAGIDNIGEDGEDDDRDEEELSDENELLGELEVCALGRVERDMETITRLPLLL